MRPSGRMVLELSEGEFQHAPKGFAEDPRGHFGGAGRAIDEDD